MIAPASPTSAAPRPQPSANTLFLSMPTRATAPASSRVASRARTKSVRLVKEYRPPQAAMGLGPAREAHDQEIDHRPEHEQRRRDQGRRQQRIDRKEREQKERR